jgi:uncharacterized protein (TIGR00730 family)
MSSPSSAQAPSPVRSVCLFCGSSDGARPEYLAAAGALGAAFAKAKLRLVYGGGGVGLMGAAARAAHAGGGRVLGVIPRFLVAQERLFDAVETVVVETMHERKLRMYEAADAFVVAPGGIGTLEEAVELLSWKRLDLHDKPVIFLNQNGFWDGFFVMMAHSVAEGLNPPEFLGAWEVCDGTDAVMAALGRLSGLSDR